MIRSSSSITPSCLFHLALVVGLVLGIGGMPVRGDGPISADDAIAGLGRPPANPDQALTRMLRDLRDEHVTGFDGRPTNLLDKFRQVPEGVLAPAQKGRILRVLSEIHDLNVRLESAIPEGAPGKGYQMVNWQHTRTEVNEVLDAMLQANARAARQGRPLLTAAQIEDAIIASAFSDSVKLPPGKNGNFFQHHIDGARAARQVLGRYYGDAARIDGIVTAIHEHQIVPPRFMGEIVRGAAVGKQKGQLVAAFKDRFPDQLVNGEPDFTSRNGRALKSVLDGIDDATRTDPAARAPLRLNRSQSRLLAALGVADDEVASFTRSVNGARDRIARPLAQSTTSGGSRIRFAPGEQAVLRGIGIDDWIVPVRNAPHSQASTFVRVGDTAANYLSSPAGTAKIVAIRGPGTPFPDHTVWDSIRSADQSLDDALTVIPEEHHPMFRAKRARTMRAIRQTGREVRSWVNANKGDYGYAKGEPVLYLDRKATAEGLSPDQLARRQALAREIRTRMDQGLRSRQRSWAAVDDPLYDVDDLARRMGRQADDAVAGKTGARVAAGKTGGRPTNAAVEPAPVARARGVAEPVPAAGGRSAGARVRTSGGHLVKGTLIGAGVGVGIEVAREIITDGRVSPKEVWDNTFGDIQNFWKPLVGGTAGALAVGAVASRLIPGGSLLATGLQFVGGSLGASALGGQLSQDPTRATAGAIGSGVGSILGGAALSWLAPPFGAAAGSVIGGIAGQFAGEIIADWWRGSAPGSGEPSEEPIALAGISMGTPGDVAAR